MKKSGMILCLILLYSIIIVSSIFLVMLSMLLAETSYDAVTISGVQGRYFISLLPLVAMLLNHVLPHKREEYSSQLIYCSVLMNSIVILYLLNEVIV